MKLIDAPVGLFMHGRTMCLKTEYFVGGRVEAYIVSSGEAFWGGVKTAEELNNLEVTPIKAKPVRHGQWKSVGLSILRCSKCRYEDFNKMYHKYCPSCGAKMDN